MDTGHARARIVIRSVNIGTEAVPGNRAPLDPPVAILYDAADIGAGEWLNTPGEIHWTLPISHPQLSVIEPYLVHFALEIERDVVGWVEVLAGLVTDFDATDQEVVFYGTDYLGLLGKLHEERFSPTVADADYKKGGSKYSDKAISFIIQNQLQAAKNLKYSPVGFITVPTITDWPEKITINAVFKQRLEFILGLMQSHAAGTGKRTRLKTVKTGPLSYAWDAQDDPGTNRDDLRFEYGGLAQGFQVVPFDDFGTKVMGVGVPVAGLKPMFAIAQPPDSSDTNEPFPEWRYGSFPKTMLWQDLIDKNDLKRRAALMARRTGKVGKKVGIGIRVDSLDVKVGWDICDAVPVDIVRGAVDTTKYGSGYYVIVGWEWKLARDGHTDLVLSFQPRDDSIAVDLTILPTDPLVQPGTWVGESGCGHPNTIALPPGLRWYFDHCSGLIYESRECEVGIDYSQCAVLTAGGATATFITRRETGEFFAPYGPPYSHIQASQQRLPSSPYGGVRQESRGILRYSVPVGATHVHLKLRMWGSTGYSQFPAPSIQQTYRWAVYRTTLAPGHTSFAEGVPFSEANWAPNGDLIAAGEAEGYSFTQTVVPYNELTGFDIDRVIPVTPGEDLTLMLINNSPNGAQFGALPDAVYDFSDAGHTDTASVVGWRDYTVSPHAGSETLMHPIGCEEYFAVQGLDYQRLHLGIELTDLATISGDIALPDYGVTVDGLIFGNWGAGSSTGTFAPRRNFTVDDARFSRAFSIDMTCWLDRWPTIGNPSFYIWITFGTGQHYRVTFNNSNLFLSYNGGANQFADPAPGPLSSLTNILRFEVDAAGVVSGHLNGTSVIAPVAVTNRTLGVTTVVVGMSKSAGPPGEALQMTADPVLSATTVYDDCWDVRPPVVWSPGDINNPVPALGQFVPERLIAIGDGVNAYFYCSTDMGVTASPYVPGTVRIRVDSLYQGVGESDPATGQILLGFIPEVGERITAEWRRAVT